ncbi:uncharacterized protein LY89DRAFT_731318 [Mollisia scopiformis]|uniref:Uncharacterized protein n=1 Tax=Mollisia scopiformis TaxID=149040 RepID=A0A194XIM6_MOLSC|nr:uncharacterized protein LY89DRAFT_731318 [Mollisia scopiformis]KUJ20085.1 hypothetical protein LY89DRAFT_731318 [Mollisia scopiformis]
MVVLQEDGNEYEIRVKRIPQNTYFDERQKFGDPEEVDATTADRYIVAEPGQMYAVEVTVKAGLKWGTYSHVRVSLRLAGGQEFVADEALTTESDISEIDPLSLAGFKILIRRRLVTTTPKDPATVYKLENRGTRVFRAQKVDQESFKKHGITFATGLGSSRVDTETCYLSKYLMEASTCAMAYFRYSTAEFFEQVKVVTWPPPLHYYTWEKLRDGQRQVALGQLQEISRDDYLIAHGTNSDQHARREWRSWLLMEPIQRQHAYNTLQKEYKDFQRGQVQTQVSLVPSHRFIIIDDDVIPNVGVASPRASHSTRAASAALYDAKKPIVIKDELEKDKDIIKSENSGDSIPRKRRRSTSVATTETFTSDAAGRNVRHSNLKKEPAIKEEPIDVDALDSQDLELLLSSAVTYDLTKEDQSLAKNVKIEAEAEERIDIPSYSDGAAIESQPETSQL